VTRSAEDIGAGLAAARAARPIRVGERIHVVGAAGAGASAAALDGAVAAFGFGDDLIPTGFFQNPLQGAAKHGMIFNQKDTPLHNHDPAPFPLAMPCDRSPRSRVSGSKTLLCGGARD